MDWHAIKINQSINQNIRYKKSFKSRMKNKQLSVFKCYRIVRKSEYKVNQKYRTNFFVKHPTQIPFAYINVCSNQLSYESVTVDKRSK